MKRVLSVILSLLLLFSLALFVSAEDGVTIQITGANSPAYVVDNADLISDSDEAALLLMAQEISQRQHCDVVILTEADIDGKSSMEYADDYFDYNGYGYGPERSGILFLISMADRDWWISTRGSAIQAFTDDGIDYLFSKCKSDISNGSYAAGFRSYLKTADTMLSAYNGTLSDQELAEFQNDFNSFTGNVPRQKPGFLKTTVLALLAGFLLAFLPSSGLRSQLKSVRAKYDAANYRRPDSMHLDRKRDIYLYANTTSHVIETQRSGGGGSSTHISSSGATHGGGGGKF